MGMIKYLADAYDICEERGGVIIGKDGRRRHSTYYSPHARALIGQSETDLGASALERGGGNRSSNNTGGGNSQQNWSVVGNTDCRASCNLGSLAELRSLAVEEDGEEGLGEQKRRHSMNKQ